MTTSRTATSRAWTIPGLVLVALAAVSLAVGGANLARYPVICRSGNTGMATVGQMNLCSVQGSHSSTIRELTGYNIPALGEVLIGLALIFIGGAFLAVGKRK